MEHRRTFHSFQMPNMDHDQLRNNRPPEHQMYPENGPLLLPVDNAAVYGLRSTTYADVMTSSTDMSALTSNMNVPYYSSSNVRSMNDPYLRPSASSVGQVPPSYCPQGSTSLYGQTNALMSNAHRIETDRKRSAFKRKMYPASMALDRPIDGSYTGESSSSNSIIPSNHVEPKPTSNFQSSAWTPMGMVQGHRNATHSFAEEGSQRNVRSRHDQGVQFSRCGTNSSNYQYFHSTATPPAPDMTAHWSTAYEPLAEVVFASHRSDVSTHDISHSNANCFRANNMEIELGHTSNFASTPRVHPSSRGLAFDHNSFGRRTTSYRIMPNYASGGSERIPEDSVQAEPVNFSSSRHSRPVFIAHRSNSHSGRNAGPRNFYHSYQSPTDEHHNRNRWASRGPLVIGRSTYFDPRNVFDEHQEMRLDIDNMSYEELLALGERIGNVSTGLSEDKLSKVLVETIYCSSDQIQDDSEELKCAICLEEYEDSENLGRLDCGHDFHFRCIKKWLQMKNVCPICKASFPADTPQ